MVKVVGFKKVPLVIMLVVGIGGDIVAMEPGWLAQMGALVRPRWMAKWGEPVGERGAGGAAFGGEEPPFVSLFNVFYDSGALRTLLAGEAKEEPATALRLSLDEIFKKKNLELLREDIVDAIYAFCLRGEREAQGCCARCLALVVASTVLRRRPDAVGARLVEQMFSGAGVSPIVYEAVEELASLSLRQEIRKTYGDAELEVFDQYLRSLFSEDRINILLADIKKHGVLLFEIASFLGLENLMAARIMDAISSFELP